jgi:hypothetical protein
MLPTLGQNRQSPVSVHCHMLQRENIVEWKYMLFVIHEIYNFAGLWPTPHTSGILCHHLELPEWVTQEKNCAYLGWPFEECLEETLSL